MKRVYIEAPNKFQEDYITKFPDRLRSYVSRSRFRSFAFRQRYLSSKYQSKSNSKDPMHNFYDVESIPVLRSVQGELKKSKSISETTAQKYRMNFLLPKQVKKIIQAQRIRDQEYISNAQQKLDLKSFSKEVQRKVRSRRNLKNLRVETQPSVQHQTLIFTQNANSLAGSVILSETRQKIINDDQKQIFASPSQISKKNYAVSKKFRMIKQRKVKQRQIPIQKIVGPFFGKLPHKQ